MVVPLLGRLHYGCPTSVPPLPVMAGHSDDGVCSPRVPIASHKTEGPATVVTFLGILIDTGRGELRLPHDKLQRLKGRLDEWGDRNGCTRKELESLIGLLNHACKVVRLGRSFLRRMIDLLHAVHRPPFSKVPIRLSQGFRADLAWWRAFLM